MKRNKNINKKLEEIYDMSSRKEYVKSKINFKEGTKTKPNFLRKLSLIYASIIGIILISISSFTTFLIMDRIYFHTSSNAGIHDEYLNEANDFLIVHFDIYDRYPMVSYYINDSYVFNLYRGRNNYDNDNTIYVCQLYNLSVETDKISIKFKNSNHDEKQIIKNENEKSKIELINTRDFQITENYLFTIIEYNDTIYDQFQINL